jgi:phosphoribosyl-AMP cyclohydrolase
MGRLRTLWPIRATETELDLAQWNSTFAEAGYPDRLGPSGKFVENYAKITCLQISDQVRYIIMTSRTSNFCLQISDQVRYIIMASRTSNQAWSKGSDAGTYCE